MICFQYLIFLFPFATSQFHFRRMNLGENKVLLVLFSSTNIKKYFDFRFLIHIIYITLMDVYFMAALYIYMFCAVVPSKHSQFPCSSSR